MESKSSFASLLVIEDKPGWTVASWQGQWEAVVVAGEGTWLAGELSPGWSGGLASGSSYVA